MSEDDDSGDLWCFHGCTIQVSRLPYVTGEGELEPAPLKCPGPGPVANPNTGAPASPSDAAGRSTDAPELNGSEGTQPRSEAGEGRAHSEETSRVGVGFSAPLGPEDAESSCGIGNQRGGVEVQLEDSHSTPFKPHASEPRVSAIAAAGSKPATPSPFSKNQSLSAVVEGLEDAIRSRPGITATEVGVLLRAVARSQAAEALAARSKEDGFHAEDWVALVQGDLCPNVPLRGGKPAGGELGVPAAAAAVEKALATCRRLMDRRRESDGGGTSSFAVCLFRDPEAPPCPPVTVPEPSPIATPEQSPAGAGASGPCRTTSTPRTAKSARQSSTLPNQSPEPDTWGLSLAQYEARAFGCWWPVTVTEPEQFSASMRRVGFRVKVAYVLDPSDTWSVDSVGELRPKAESGREWSEGLAPCLRGIGHCRHAGCLAAIKTLERNSSGSVAGSRQSPSCLYAKDSDSSPSRDCTFQQQNPPPLPGAAATPPVSLSQMDPGSLLCIMSFLDGQSIAMLACTCSMLHEMAADDSIWRVSQLRSGRHPRFGIPDGGWKCAYLEGQAIDSNWRRRRCTKTEWNDHSDCIYHVHRLGDMAVTSSADGSLRVFALGSRNCAPLQNKATADGSQHPVGDGDARDGEDGSHQEDSNGREADECSAREEGMELIHPDVAAVLKAALPGQRGGSCIELLGHTDHVTCAGTLLGGRIIVSCAVDDAFKVWKLPEKRCVATQRGIAGQGFCKFTIVERPWGSDTPCVVAGSMGGKGVTVWNMESWQQSTELDHNSQEFYSVCVPNGTSIVLGAAGDSKVHVWDLRQGGKSIAELDGTRRGSVRCVDAEENLVCSGGADGTVRIFDRRMWGLIKVLKQHDDLVNTIALDLGTGLVVSGGDDGKICPLRLPTWKVCSPISTRVGVLSVAFDHSRLLAGCEDNALRFWDFKLVDNAGYFDTDAWAAVARMAEARSQGSGSGAMLTPGPPASASTAATSARHARGSIVSPGAGYPHMDGFHS